MNAIPKLQTPAQITFIDFELSPKDQLSWDSWATHTRYCNYFALSLENDIHPMGKWDAPFFSIEELNAFARNIVAVHPELDDQLTLMIGNIHVSILDNAPHNAYWQIWQDKHRERIAKLEQINKERAERHEKRKAELLKRWEYVKSSMNDCFYFCVFRKGHEVYPFGLNQTPYFTYEEAEQEYRVNQLTHRGEEFYIGFGGFDIDFIMDGECSSEAEQKWIDQHKLRIQALKSTVAA
ncbi:hypothetical protein [Acinetobacter bereziniae]|uniref:hypothetical protein n=1 Tax=Acinetobacter bereziniae TaxID=106648 RepID=UPI002255A8B3|nr:hypothetical protein [Acinetobacter bereziniae]